MTVRSQVTRPSRAALLVDGDNVSPVWAEQMLTLASRQARVDVRQVYMNARRNDGWHTAYGFRMIHAGSGKNAADILLCIDAVQLALRDGIDHFFVASSDGDFSHLAERLRSYGFRVTGLGTDKASARFRAACSDFTELTPPVTEAQSVSAEPVRVDWDQRIRDVISANSTGGKGLGILHMGPKMREAGITLSALGAKTYRSYFRERPDLFEVRGSGQETMVRYKPAGFAARTP